MHSVGTPRSHASSSRLHTRSNSSFTQLITPAATRANNSVVTLSAPSHVVHPVSVSVHRLRVFGITVVLVGVLGALTYFLIDGFKIDTRDATKLSDGEKSKLLDRYNTYSGGFASIVSMPLHPFVAMLVPVFFLCYTTKAVMSDNKSLIALKGPMLGAVAVAWLLGQGMNALNVQFDSPSVEFIISDGDLINSDAEFSFGSTAITDITDTINTAGVANTDTILRRSIRSSTPNYSTSCTWEGGILYEHPEASVRFGFSLNSWLEDMLPESIASDESFSFSMADVFVSGTINVTDLPGGDLNKTAELFSYALWSVWTAFQHVWVGNPVGITDKYNAMDKMDAADLLSSVQDLIRDYNDSSTAWPNISIPEISISLATFNPSSQVKFESITFELPVENTTMRDWVPDSTTSDWSYTLQESSFCNDQACVMPTPIIDGFNQDQVRMIRLCMLEANGTQENLEAIWYSATNSYDYTCKFPSNSSTLIFSLARHVTVDEIEITIPEANGQTNIVLTRPRVTYKVTVGRLSWETSDLAQVYGAKCADGVDCDGLHFPLGDGNRHVVVGKSNLPAPRQVIYPVYFEAWQVLAHANTHIGTTRQGDIIYPPMYPSSGLQWSSLDKTQCAYTGSDYINDVIQQHIYSKDPVQPAYTAGLFWLFQNAAVKDVATSNETAESGVKLNFAGNRLWLSSRVSIPPVSAWITFTGCAVLLIIGMLVTCARQSELSSNLSAQCVAGILLGIPEYPGLLVTATVFVNKAEDSVLRSTQPEQLDQFVIDQVTLSHQTDEAIQSIVIAPATGCQSV